MPHISGYIIFKNQPGINYCGVDRPRIEPLLPNELFEKNIRQINSVWELYTTGWERKAYRIYEENAIELDNDILMITNMESAFEIKNIIQQHYNYLSVYRAYVFDEFDSKVPALMSEKGFVGFDIAYLGGDFFSAVKGGMFVNPSPYLKDKYSAYLNAYGLFSEATFLDEYITDFKREAESEQSSKFYKYLLSDVT